jgi:S1-C subfamily serine protease
LYNTYTAYRYQKLWNANSIKLLSSVSVLSILFIVTITFYVELGLGSGSKVQSFANQDNNLLSSLYDKVSNPTTQIISASPYSPEIPNAAKIGAGFIYNDSRSIVTSNRILQGADSVDLVLKNGDRYVSSVIGRLLLPINMASKV